MKKYQITEVDAGFVRMTVTRFGSGGKNMIIIPGISMKPVSESAEAVAFQYKKMWDDYTVYLFDGRQDVYKGYTVREMAKDTAAVMKTLGISDAYALGVSQGGMILQHLMTDYPETVKAAVVCSSFSRANRTSAEVLGEWADIARVHDVRKLNHKFFTEVYSPERIEKYKDALPVLEGIGTAKDCDRMAVLCDACNTFNAYDELYKIKCPVLAVGSARDKILTVEGTEELARKLGCEMYIYDGYSHAVYDEAPDFVDRILDFYKRQGA